MAFFDRFREKRHHADIASALYLTTVQQSRLPRFYLELNVPDTVDGRFDMIVLHVTLLIRRLRGEGKLAVAVSQELLDLLIADMDRNFREMGIGDMSIGKHVKKVAKAFYGRAEILESGLETGADAVASGLLETLYRTIESAKEPAKILATYVIGTDQHLANQSSDCILAGHIRFDVEP